MWIDYICNNIAGNMLVNFLSFFDHPLILEDQNYYFPVEVSSISVTII
jgi:hypothetical protein